ncbi:MAG: hypothetical protein Q8M07_04125 [Prosthecobacter sp.]|nr:hypothetical protein [Prosthecobacter sp.]
MAQQEAVVRNQSIQALNRAVLREVAWDNVTEPGTYVDVRTGDLFRIPQEGLVTGASPVVMRETAVPAVLRQLSDDPFLPTLKARLMCAQHNIQPNF